MRVNRLVFTSLIVLARRVRNRHTRFSLVEKAKKKRFYIKRERARIIYLEP